MALLSTIIWILRSLLCCSGRPPRQSNSQQKLRLVIAGGSFGGLAICRELTSYMDTLDVYVVEPKDYVEYTPGMLRALTYPEETCNALQISLADCLPTGVKHVKGYVDAVDAGEDERGGELCLRGAPVESLPFDILVLATGSIYPPPCKAHPDEQELGNRRFDLQGAHEHLAQSDRVVIVGGGPVGVELAAEIRYKWQNKRVTIIQGATSLLMGLPGQVIDAATNWMKVHDIEVLLGQKVEAHDTVYDVNSAETAEILNKKPHKHTLSTSAGISLVADAVFYCVGTHPQSEYLRNSSDWLQRSRLADGRVRVDECLSVAGNAKQAIFAVGDVLQHPFLKEPLLAYTAEKHAHAVGKSIRAICDAQERKDVRLCRYPRDLTGKNTSPDIMCVSLGPGTALLAFDSILLADAVIGQRVAALMKTVIEYTKVLQLKNHPIGVAFWAFADFMSMQMHKLLPQRR